MAGIKPINQCNGTLPCIMVSSEHVVMAQSNAMPDSVRLDNAHGTAMITYLPPIRHRMASFHHQISYGGRDHSSDFPDTIPCYAYGIVVSCDVCNGCCRRTICRWETVFRSPSTRPCPRILSSTSHGWAPCRMSVYPFPIQY